MRHEVSRALDVVYQTAQHVPQHYFKECYGIICLSVNDFGVLVTGTAGSGMLMSHDPQTNVWGPPLSVTLSALGMGLVLGSERRDIIVFLHSHEILLRFATKVRLQLGTHSARTLGQHWDDAEKHPRTFHATRDSGSGFEGNETTSFSYCRGVFCGISMEGVIIKSNTKRHKDFYGAAITPKHILLGYSSIRCNRTSGVYILHKKLASLADPSLNFHHEPRGPHLSTDWDHVLQGATVRSR
jgi:lipid-binding SYLF domain-containing protein